MSSIIKQMVERNIIKPPPFLSDSVQYEGITGSDAYGVTSNSSDIDIMGFCIPPKEMVFPHLAGEIYGFGKQIQRFEQFQNHHIKDSNNNKEYDFTIYSIVKFFQLCMENNPNMVDILFIPNRCVLHVTDIGKMVRENRKIFLHKGSFFKFKGYAYSQIHKIKTKKPEGKRKELIDKYNYDVKHGYHCKRLLLEIEQILLEGDLDLERNRNELKPIRNGEVTLEQLLSWFEQKEKHLEDLYSKSKLRHSPDEESIKTLLLNCLEEYYGNLSDVYIPEDIRYDVLKNDLKKLAIKHGF